MQIKKKFDFAKNVIDSNFTGVDFITDMRNEFQERMSACGAHIRDYNKVSKAVSEAWEQYRRLKTGMKVVSSKELPTVFRTLDLCLTHAVYLEAIKEYLINGGKSRGSYLVLDPEGEKPCEELTDEWKFTLTDINSPVNKKILEIYLDDDYNIKKQWVDITPVPKEDTWFENVWNEFMKNNIIK